ncbi:MAG: hypothetical protein QXF24_09130 [Thermoproteota archaeon]
MGEGIEFSGGGWDCYRRMVRLNVDGKEVVVARAQAVPWKEMDCVGSVTISGYLSQERTEEDKRQRLSASRAWPSPPTSSTGTWARSKLAFRATSRAGS